MSYDVEETGLTFVGAPMEVVRATDSKYLDQARSNFSQYVANTLQASMGCGGRYNAPGAFGALYCAIDEDTAWVELAARFRREGIAGLPPVMALLRILITDGRYADLTDDSTISLWDFDKAALIAAYPTPEQQEHCHRVGSSVRPVGDFLLAPSARADGQNIPVFPDREDRGLMWNLVGARSSSVPWQFAQVPTEQW